MNKKKSKLKYYNILMDLIYILIIIFVVIIISQIFFGRQTLVEGMDDATTPSTTDTTTTDTSTTSSTTDTTTPSTTDASYKPYNLHDPNNSLILSQQNAGNIEYLKKKIDDLQNINSTVNDLSGNVVALQEQVNGLVSQQQQYASQVSGGTAPEVSGTDSDNPPDTSDLVTPD
jgi:FtsZ-interacting cell division protein ZipA